MITSSISGCRVAKTPAMMEGGVEVESRRFEKFRGVELERRCGDGEFEDEVAQYKEGCLVEREERRK